MLKIYDYQNQNELMKLLRDRAENIPDHVMNAVSGVLNSVRNEGDKAVREWSQKFDGVAPENFYMSKEEIQSYTDMVSDELKAVIRRAADNIRKYHEGQVQQSRILNGNAGTMGQRVIPMKRAGLYVPGGTAAYPSSVLMNAIPAKVAGVSEVIMATPPKANGGINPAVIYAAEVAGVDKIITVGGAQAIAAMAYGTETIDRVDIIVGPGNIYVAMAKKLVYGTVAIDMIAGPSEILIIADQSASPKNIAADLLSQAEHDKLAAAILITTDPTLPERVNTELEAQLAKLNRCEIASESIRNFGSAIVMPDLESAAALSDEIAPEHLELAVEDPFSVLAMIHNAGSVFLGQNTPEPLADYYAGPNHVLPTNGTARFASPLSCDTFVKKSSFLYYNADELKAAAADVIAFAEAEGLQAHANSIRVRTEK